MDPIRVGMVGVANFGKYRRDTMRQTGLFKFIAVYDYNADAAAVAAREENCAVAESYDALLANDDIEAIVVSTGANSHAEYCIRAAEVNKHFFVEKPLCTNWDELYAMLEAGEKRGVQMGMGHNPHDGPTDQLLRDYIAQDKLGTVTAIEMTTAHGGGWCSSPWRFIPEKNPGGMLFQCGVHSIAWLEGEFERVTEVSAMMRFDVNENTKTSDATIVNMRTASGILVSLQAYHVTAYHHYQFVYGTKGNLYFYHFPTEVYYQARNVEGKPEDRIRIENKDFPTGKDRSTNNVATWAKAIRGEGVPTPSIYDGASAVAAVFAADESARTGRTIQVPDLRARMKVNV